jgi:hypothetical protein
MNRGCVIFALALVVLIGIAGFFAYRAFRDSLAIPEEFAAYKDKDSMEARLSSHEPAPHDTTALTADDVTLLIGAFGPINSGWKPLEAKFDSLGLSKSSKGSSLNILSTPQLLSEIVMVGPRTRKALVEYLNSRNLSLDRYVWLKEHVVAASGIRRGEVDSAVGARLAAYFGASDNVKGKHDSGDVNFDQFFDRVEAIRAAGTIDSAEAALVLPHRATIIEEGLPCLMGVETNYSFRID